MPSESLLPNAIGALVDDGIHITWRLSNETTSLSYICWPAATEEVSHIPYHSIVWCSPVADTEDVFEISYVTLISKLHKMKLIFVQLSEAGYQSSERCASQILSAAYTGSFHQPRILLLLNTKGGKGDGAAIYKSQIEPILRAARTQFTCIETTHSKHAMQIGQEVDISKYDIVACCSGDGIPHEFINGLYKRQDSADAFNKLAVTQLPCGSGNAFSLSTYGTCDSGLATLEMLKLSTMKMDVMLLQQRDNTFLSFLSQAYGAIADSDIGTEHLRWMGPVRFELGLAYKVFTKARYPCDLYVKYAIENKQQIKDHFRLYNKYQDSKVTTEVLEVTSEELRSKYPSITSSIPDDWKALPSQEMDNLSIFYVGNMPYVLTDAQFFPAAIPDDGCMDLLLFNSKMSVLDYTNLLLNVSNGGHVHHDEVRHAKVTAYRLVPRVDPKHHYISIDGESFPVEPIQVEVLPKVLTVLLKDKSYVETRFGEH
ncbi:hypothetical protein PUMCH_001831 [Australozyma saopauloensis]|uniref:DAGKc domain-containing protein n=1 Tax=Australozyma saopauloensis TaxID=291208 RepID=A0AAX4H7T5_9ASCO|nr:hypothetical protein PUMCH_001831 [[Candida] saopauloensis]